jgi:hypothetical protein
VTFDIPVSDGGSTITSYTVTPHPTGTPITGATSPITITGLTNNTAYTFTVKAKHLYEDSIESDPSQPVTPNVAVIPVANITSAHKDISYAP